MTSREVFDFLEHDFDRVDAAATFRCAAERGINGAHSRTGYGARNCGPYLRLAEDVAGAHNHDALLAEQADKHHDKKQAAYGSTPSSRQTEGGRGRHMCAHLSSPYQHLASP